MKVSLMRVAVLAGDKRREGLVDRFFTALHDIEPNLHVAIGVAQDLDLSGVERDLRSVKLSIERVRSDAGRLL